MQDGIHIETLCAVRSFTFFPFTNSGKLAIIARLLSKCTGGSMDRASDSGSEGWGFESLPVYQIKEEIPFGISSFISPSGRKGTRRL